MMKKIKLNNRLRKFQSHEMNKNKNFKSKTKSQCYNASSISQSGQDASDCVSRFPALKNDINYHTLSTFSSHLVAQIIFSFFASLARILNCYIIGSLKIAMLYASNASLISNC